MFDYRKPSVLWLLISNLFVLTLAIIFDWKLYDILIIFWVETFIIGISNVFKMIKVKYRPKTAQKIMESIPETESKEQLVSLGYIFIKMMTINFFVIIFIGFTLMQGIVINQVFSYIESSNPQPSIFEFSIENKWMFFISIIMIGLSHRASYRSNYIKNKEYESTSLKKLFFSPFRRLFLVWLVIIGGTFVISTYGKESTLIILVFFLLKILSDLFQHYREHKSSFKKEKLKLEK